MSKLGKVWLYLILFLTFVSGGLIIYFYGYDYGLEMAGETTATDTTVAVVSFEESLGVWEHGITWFEIPVVNILRAKSFYENLLNTELEIIRDSANNEMIFLPPYGEGIITGSLVKSSNSKPSGEGVLVFLNCNPNLSTHLQRAITAGSTVLQQKKLISEEIGYMAIIKDSEGNRIALHSSN